MTQDSEFENENMRKSNRCRLTQYLRVFDRKTGELLGQLENISVEGIMLSGDKVLEEGKICHMWMDLPSDMSDCIQITFNARIVWSSKYTNADLYNTGFQFTKINEQNIELIKRLIEAYCNES